MMVKRNRTKFWRLTVLVAVLGLTAGACGSDDGETEAATTTTEPSAPAAEESDEPTIVSDAPLEETDLTIPNISESMLLLPRMVAQEEGLFEKHGLNVTVVDAPSTRAIDLFLSGEMVYGPTFAGVIPPIVANGAPISLYGVTGDKSNYSFWVTPDIESLEDLDGKVVGISGFGGKPEQITREIFAKYGFDADKVTFQPLGNVSAIVQAMVQGQVHAGAFGNPSTVIAAENGLRMLYSAEELDLQDVSSALVGNAEWVEANTNSAKAFTRAWVEAVWIVFTDPERSKEVFARYMDQDVEANSAEIDDGYDELMATLQHPRDIGKNLERHLEIIYGSFDEMERIEDEKVILPEIDIFAQLEEEGFFDALEDEYGSIPES